MLMRAAATSPLSEPSARMSTRSGGRDVAFDLAQNHDLARSDVGHNLSITPNGDAVARQALDTAFDLAVDEWRLGAGCCRL